MEALHEEAPYVSTAILLVSRSSAQTQSQPLEVRHITIGMTQQQVDAAASAAGMRREPGGMGVRYLDTQASGRAVGGDSGSGGHGLVMEVHFSSGVSDRVWIREQGDFNGSEVTRDVSKKWGPAKSAPENPSYYHHSLPWWGNPKGVWAEMPFNMCNGDCPVIIQGPDKPSAKKDSGIPM